jgi:hypothetical protein
MLACVSDDCDHGAILTAFSSQRSAQTGWTRSTADSQHPLEHPRLCPVRTSSRDDRSVDRQELFDRTVARLDTIVTAEFDAYSALESSGLVRKLLLDDDPLLHQVNHQRRKRVRFEVASNPAYEREILSHNPIFWAPVGALSPRLTIVRASVVQALTLRESWPTEQCSSAGTKFR